MIITYNEVYKEFIYITLYKEIPLKEKVDNSLPQRLHSLLSWFTCVQRTQNWSQRIGKPRAQEKHRKPRFQLFKVV